MRESFMKFFSLLFESLQVTNQELETAYGYFVNEVGALMQSGTDMNNLYRQLNLTRIEFMALQPLLKYGQGKKCVQKAILPKSNMVSRIGNRAVETNNFANKAAFGA